MPRLPEIAAFRIAALRALIDLDSRLLTGDHVAASGRCPPMISLSVRTKDAFKCTVQIVVTCHIVADRSRPPQDP